MHSSFRSFIESLDRKSALNNGRPFQEILKHFAALQILEKHLNRHSRPSEYGNTVHRLRVL